MTGITRLTNNIERKGNYIMAIATESQRKPGWVSKQEQQGKVVNPTTHVLKNYYQHGRLKVPNTSGGMAFAKALELKGVRLREPTVSPMSASALAASILKAVQSGK